MSGLFNTKILKTFKIFCFLPSFSRDDIDNGKAFADSNFKWSVRAIDKAICCWDFMFL